MSSERNRLSAWEPIHVSGIGTIQKCPRQWRLTDRHWGHGFRQPVQTVPIMNGSFTHGAMRYWYGSDKQLPLDECYQLAVNDWVEDLGSHEFKPWEAVRLAEAEDLTKAMIRGYALWVKEYTGPYSDDNLTYLAVEHECGVTVGEFDYEMTVDGLAVDRSGELWVIEYKTAARPKDIVNAVQIDLQPRAYCWAMSELLEKPVSGIIYNVMRRCDPFQIKILKNGWPTQSKQDLAGTTYAIYLNLLSEIAAAQPNPEAALEWAMPKYAEALDWLKEQERLGEGLFYRVPVRFSPQVLARVPDVLERWARRMVAENGDHALPAMDRHTCPYCPVREICRLMDEEMDWLDVAKHTLVSKKYPRPEEALETFEVETY